MSSPPAQPLPSSGAPLVPSPPAQGALVAPLSTTVPLSTQQNTLTPDELAALKAGNAPNGFTLRKTNRLPPAASPAAVVEDPPYPALHLAPLNDTFVPKQISLAPPGMRIKIGRQTNAKTVPNGYNGFFDSKVLSRMHAEVWCEGDKVFIKDVKSSNGTFINGERLSQEAAESDIFELHSEDIVEFGIDIVSDDNKTIVHHKVAAKVFIVMNQEDAAASTREFSNWYRASSESAHRQRNTKILGSNGLSYDHVINKLQGELQKSRDTGTDLGTVTTTLNQVQDMLQGGAPPLPLPPFPHPRTGSSPAQKDMHASSIAHLQSQLTETQLSLADQQGKLGDLEGLLKEQARIRAELGGLRETVEGWRREMGLVANGGRGRVTDGRESPIAKLLEEEEDDDDDDARSNSSIDTVRDGPPRDRLGRVPTTREGLQAQNMQLSTRLDNLSSELEQALLLSATLRTQHAQASSTIAGLESKIAGLESAVEQSQERAEEREAASELKWEGWRTAFEQSWRQERSDWGVEREKLLRVVREWDELRVGESDEDVALEMEADEEPLVQAGRKKTRRRRRSGHSRLSKATRELLGSASDDAAEEDSRSSGTSSSGSPRASHRSRGSSRSATSTTMAQALPYASAGAVLVVGIAAAWALSVKLKD